MGEKINYIVRSMLRLTPFLGLLQLGHQYHSSSQSPAVGPAGLPNWNPRCSSESSRWIGARVRRVLKEVGYTFRDESACIRLTQISHRSMTGL